MITTQQNAHPKLHTTPRSEALQRLEEQLASCGYIADTSITMAIFLATTLQKPLLIEGPAGVGKTEIAKVIARIMNTELIRLQCYEGLDANAALYEWNYQHQLLHLKLEEIATRTGASTRSLEEQEASIFSERFLLRRPLLRAITQHTSPVLLVDELDRADEEFESFFLEILSEWQITIPELGTITATHIPVVVITSNRVRELSEALRRRCLYLWIDYPALEKEIQIVRTRLPEIDMLLATHICRFMHAIREQASLLHLSLNKVPGVAETLDWARALLTLHTSALRQMNADLIDETLGVIFKSREDIHAVRRQLRSILESLSEAV
jgi:MoxR-like ATPase